MAYVVGGLRCEIYPNWSARRDGTCKRVFCVGKFKEGCKCRKRKTRAKVKLLSCEPLIGALTRLNLKKIDWVIVGGESGQRPRPMDPDWVLDIQEQCEKAGVAFFFKQWGGRNKKKNGRILNGRTYDEMPEIEQQLSV